MKPGPNLSISKREQGGMYRIGGGGGKISGLSAVGEEKRNSVERHQRAGETFATVFKKGERRVGKKRRFGEVVCTEKEKGSLVTC